MVKRIDIPPGARFGLLTVTAIPDDWRFLAVRCDCGTEKNVRRGHLRDGKIISCGCEHSRRSSARTGNMHRANTTHGMSRTRVHNIWHGMRQRCFNPNNRFFGYYGGRGITICERWLTFENFLADMGEPGPKMTLDRIDNNGNYEPGNCRWATRAVQMGNRRVCRKYTMDGETRTVSEWARMTNIPRSTLFARLDAGDTLEHAIAKEKRAKQKEISRAALMASHCKRGHEWAVTAAWCGQVRYCRECQRLASRRYEARKRLARSR